MQTRLFSKCALLGTFFLLSFSAPILANGNPDATPPVTIQAPQVSVFICDNGQCIVSGVLDCCPKPPDTRMQPAKVKPPKDKKITLAPQTVSLGFSATAFR